MLDLSQENVVQNQLGKIVAFAGGRVIRDVSDADSGEDIWGFFTGKVKGLEEVPTVLAAFPDKTIGQALSVNAMVWFSLDVDGGSWQRISNPSEAE